MAVPTPHHFSTIQPLKKSAIITPTHNNPNHTSQTKLRTCIILSSQGMKLQLQLPSVPSQSSLSSIDTINNNPYEPKSVLDLRRSPPSPVIGNSSESELKFNSDYDNTLSFPLEENFEIGMINNNQVGGWDSDSLMRELGLYDDDDDFNKSNNNNYYNHYHPLDLPDFPPFLQTDFENLNPYLNQNVFDGNDFEFMNDLILLAECFETMSFQLGEVILARLNQRLTSPTGKPVQRAAFYFKEAIRSLLTGSTQSFKSCTSYEIVQVIKAYNAFSTVSPIPMFTSFTANQAILDAVEGAMNVHVIDFDIGFGGHWASFLKAVAEKAENRKVNPPAVRITAVVPEEYELESRLIKANLHQFCTDLKLRFEIDFVSIRAFEYLSFKSIKFINGEKTAVVLSSAILRRIGSGFVNDLRRVSPSVVVYVDTELNGYGSTLFRQTVIDGVRLYTTILESLEAVNVGGGMGGEWMRSIERFVLLPRIMVTVENASRSVTPWKEALGRAGMKAVGMSRFAEFQAECLVRRMTVRGFHVVKQEREMVLCWHDRPIVATSAWAFQTM